MKQVKVKFPAKLVDTLASELYDCDGVTMFSWSVDELFSDSSIIAVVAIPDGSVDKFNSSFGKYIVK